MMMHRDRVSWLIPLMAGLWASTATAQAEENVLQKWAASHVASLQLPSHLRAQILQVVDEPTIFGAGPLEVFAGNPLLYQWLLDHPDVGAQAWRRIGAKCMAIEDRRAGRFGWTDGHGSDMTWRTVYCSPELRIWYAEGSVRPAPLLPLVPVRAVIVLRHSEGSSRGRSTLIHHQAYLFAQTDNKAAARIAQLLGASVPKLTEQCLAQMELFFSGLVWYLDKHPERALSLGVDLRAVEAPLP